MTDNPFDPNYSEPAHDEPETDVFGLRPIKGAPARKAENKPNTEAEEDAAFRASVVGASEVAALFDCHPWLTKFELWQRKAGNIATSEFNRIDENGVPDNERAYWGVRLESAIIEAAKERYGYTDREQIKSLTDGKGLGGHPDRRVICPKRGPGILETKMVDWLERKKWGDEPPLNYLLQNQTYQGLDRVTWGDMIVLVGGNQLERFQYDFRPGLYGEIETRTRAFWASVKAGKSPKPEYARDGGVLAEMYGDPNDTAVDLRHDNRATILACEYLEAKEVEKAATERVDAIKAELLEKLGDNSFAMVEGYSVRIPAVAGSPDRIITADMIGQVIKGRKSHRRFYIKELAA